LIPVSEKPINVPTPEVLQHSDPLMSKAFLAEDALCETRLLGFCRIYAGELGSSLAGVPEVWLYATECHLAF